ncbi:MAG: hypothetical protein COS35_06465 [Zetaproteobacteria bacterium CG02_land_8_20_14_3_00_50_9]|nr:MAG: hypothetical protein AUJ57_07800 [Zetaproteobacteria bacterium CG1_02_53_45]PIV30483.1 MAG: hypothetical protein COS35_06465 [Zetaproteobacteria bacterium CG02_land_8_20_14_3_00_50_9]
MADQTTNFGWLKPLIGQVSQWGKWLRSFMDDLDAKLGAEHNTDGTHGNITAVDLAITGNADIAGNITAVDLAITGNADIGGAADIGGPLTVAGSITSAGMLIDTVTIQNALAAAEAAAAAAAQDALNADEDRIAAEAAWTAALAANPDLNPALRMNPSAITADITVPAGYNGYSAGPLEISEGIDVTVADTANWTII